MKSETAPRKTGSGADEVGEMLGKAFGDTVPGVPDPVEGRVTEPYRFDSSGLARVDTERLVVPTPS